MSQQIPVDPGDELPLVRVENLTKHFPLVRGLAGRTKGLVHAVDGVSFEIRPGKSLGLVGESGCGKTTTGRLLMRLDTPTAGTIAMQNDVGALVDIATHRGAALKAFRRRAQMIFQDPYDSLNPRHTVEEIVSEPLIVQRVGTRAERRERVANLLRMVGLTPPETFLKRLPDELSGGQRQRVAIARALVIRPAFVVADEPTSMLDVSIRIGVMRLMIDLAARFGISYLVITHDLAAARQMCQHIAVMYLGKIVEQAAMEEMLAHPLHPYTQALIAATPSPDPRQPREEIAILGNVSRAVDPLPRCRFYERCPIRDEECRVNPHPPLEDKGSGHLVACYKV